MSLEFIVNVSQCLLLYTFFKTNLVTVGERKLYTTYLLSAKTWLISDLQALYLSGTYCHKTGIRPPSCVIPPQTL